MTKTKNETGKPDIAPGDLIAVLRRALGIAGAPPSEDPDCAALFELAVSQQLTAAVFLGLSGDERFAASPVYADFYREAQRAMDYCRTLSDSADVIGAVFGRNGVPYMFLKGADLKDLYPKKGMRFMTDCDIFVRSEDYPRIRGLMTDLGYSPESEKEDREYVWIKGGVRIELHTSLIYWENGALDSYYSENTDRIVRPGGSGGLTMSDEDMYVYLFTHFAKHYRHLGAGVKYVSDLYLYRRAHPDMDDGYIGEQLSQMGTGVFHGHILALMDMWFCGGDGDDRSAFLEERIVFNGVYGNREKYLTDREVNFEPSKRPRLKRFAEIVFPGRNDERMAEKYPYIKKHPYLLPFAWVCRWVRVLLTDRKSISKKLGTVGKVSPGAIDEFKAELEFVGL